MLLSSWGWAFMSLSGVAKSARGLTVAALLLGTALSGCATSHGTISGSADITGSITVGDITLPADVKPSKSGMSLQNVLVQTIERNPDIGIARSQAKDAKAGIGVAQAPYLPTIDYGAAIGPERTYAYDTDITTNATRQEASIRASQLIFDFGKTFSDIDRAKALNLSAEQRLVAKTSEITMAAIEAYLAVLEIDQQIGVSEQNVTAHDKMYRIVSLNEQGGNGTKADVQKALTRLEAARNQTIDLRAERRTAASAFQRVTGAEPAALKMPNPPASTAKVTRDDVARYAATNPLLLSLEQDKLSLQAQKRALQLDYLPKLTLDGTAKVQMNVGGTNPARADGRIMLSLNGTLFDGGDRLAKINQIDARISETEYRYTRAVDNLEYDIDDSSRVLGTASSRLASIAGQIKSGKQVVTLYSQQFEAGTRGIFELLDAQQELSVSQAGLITAQFDVLRAKYHLLQLTNELNKVL